MGKEWPQFGHLMSLGIDQGNFYKSKFLSINQLRFFFRLRSNIRPARPVYEINDYNMKYTGILLVAAMALTGTASAQQEQVRSVSGFTSIGNAGPFGVHVKINGTESLKIVAAND